MLQAVSTKQYDMNNIQLKEENGKDLNIAAGPGYLHQKRTLWLLWSDILSSRHARIWAAFSEISGSAFCFFPCFLFCISFFHFFSFFSLVEALAICFCIKNSIGQTDRAGSLL